MTTTLKLLTLAAGFGAVLHCEPDSNAYILKFPGSPPTNGALALSTFNDRASAVLQFLACGNEAAFADGAALRSRPDKDPKFADAEDVGEGMLHMIQAKMIVFSGWPNLANLANNAGGFSCRQTVTLSVKPPKKMPGPQDSTTPDFVKAVQKTITDLTNANNALNTSNVFGAVCQGETVSVTGDANAATLTVTYSVSRACLRQQINQYMRAAYVNGIPGSSGLACFPFPIGTSDGEWDVNLKEITRIYNLNEQTADSVPLLPNPRWSGINCWSSIAAASVRLACALPIGSSPVYVPFSCAGYGFSVPPSF
jgi:hypothetical protein